MTNISASKALIQKLYDHGVRSFVICSGGRNAAFIETFTHLQNLKDVDIHWGFEERSASFFALGRAKRTGFAAAVFTTSGTALIETHPAVIEANYAGIPLAIVSADRPMKLWGTGAPQTIHQKDLFVSEIGPSIDWQDEEALEKAIYPMHINCPMSEPLIDEELKTWVLETQVSKLPSDVRVQASYGAFENLDLNNLVENHSQIKRPFFVLSGLNKNEADEVEFLKTLKIPLYLEATASFLNFPKRISSETFDLNFIKKHFDALIRVGSIPTHKIWRKLEEDRSLRVLNFSHKRYPGRSNDEVYSLSVLKTFIESLDLDFDNKTFTQIKSRQTKLKKIFSENTKSEMNFFAKLKKALAKTSNVQVFLGNSLPIRMWDMLENDVSKDVYANRGVNGIDGLLSTAYGLAYKSKEPVVAIIGDLSALYDLTGPWFYYLNKKDFNIKIVIINNSGGRIFSSLYTNPNFTNPHKLSFDYFAKLWGLEFKKIKSVKNLVLDSKKWPDVFELQPDNKHTENVWKKIKKLHS